MSRSQNPREDSDTLARWGTDHLTRVIAIDSQSDENSETIPSSEGQRVLSNDLQAFFRDLGYATEQDDNANLIVTIPSNLAESSGAKQNVPAIAMMVHMDTSEGTQAVPALDTTPAWDGSRIAYSQNDRLQITAENYPETASFKGDDLLHGPGRFPIGLDDKLGMSELMTLARVLQSNPEIRHGEIVLVFRPDEEISRMAAIEGLAGELARRGVRYGYTIDGIEPFEINVENFNAARGRVHFAGAPLELPSKGATRRVSFRIGGVNTHGATAKPEGYRNATVIWAKALERLGERDYIRPIDFATDAQLECNAEVRFVLCGESEDALDKAREDLAVALKAEIEPHEWKGAFLESMPADSPAPDDNVDDAAIQLARHIQRFLATPGVAPVLSEDSEGFEGYSNPHAVTRSDGKLVLSYRFRDFDPAGLAKREDHLRQVCREGGIDEADYRIESQYINMGPKLASYPELATWAEEALRATGREPVRRPIRGGTGVDPFLEQNIPVANLGTGYFAPESEKEFTSRQNIARHTLWLTHLVQVIAAAAD